MKPRTEACACGAAGHTIKGDDPAAAPLDEQRLARALLRAVPGYARWMDRPALTHNAAKGQAASAETEALTHAHVIARAYREDTK